MRTVAQSQNVTLRVTENDLINGEWIPVTRVSALLSEKEDKDRTAYKALRVKFYNSCAGKKYNTKDFAGLKCVSTKDPMVSNTISSLVLAFEKED